MSYAPSFLSNWKIKSSVLGYMCGFTSVQGLYAGRLSESTLIYSNASWRFDCIIVVFVLTDQLYVHNEHNMGEVIIW